MSDDCPNPLLLQWVKEWYDKAREQNSKGQFTYRKAYESLKACPLPFVHPSQAQELKGLGPKLCERLTDKLKEHCAANGLPMPEDPRNKAKTSTTASVIDPSAAQGSADATNPTAEEASVAPPRRPRARKPRTYVPAQRSGAYAIMLALSTLPDAADDPRAGLTKNQIIDIAQAHCDSSFVAPSEPGRTYTAWSAIKTLMNKDLICVGSGASKKYMLTEEGWDVAKRVWIAGGLDRQSVLGAAGVEASVAVGEPNVTGASQVDEDKRPKMRAGSVPAVGPTKKSSTPQCLPTYEETRERPRPTERSSEPPPETSQPPRKAFRMPSVEPMISKPAPASRQAPTTNKLAEIIDLSSDGRDSDDDLLDELMARGPKRRRIEAPVEAPAARSISVVPESSLPPPPEQAPPRPFTATDFVELISSSPPPVAPLRRAPLQPKDDSALNTGQPRIPKDKGCVNEDDISPYAEPHLENAPAPSTLHPSKTPMGPATSTRPSTAFDAAANAPRSELPPVPSDIKPVHIPPESFTVELLVDTREVRSRTDRTYLQDGLLAQGIRPHTRALELGDVQWVARVHDAESMAALGLSPVAALSDPANPSPAAEVVLPFIVERKRLDDLIASLKDGRYREQKFRLRRSGLANVTYLIEETALSLEARQRWHEAVRSATAATLAQDGFFVRRTRSLDDSIRYLARLTRSVRAAYAADGVWILPERALERLEAPAKNRAQADAMLEAWKATVAAGTEIKTQDLLLTYPAFSARAAKDAARTVRAVYLRMLMATRGITAWKARAIQQRYPTPKALGDAYQAKRATCVAAGQNQAAVRRELADMLANDLGHWSFGRGKIGKAVSAKVAAVWAGIGD